MIVHYLASFVQQNSKIGGCMTANTVVNQKVFHFFKVIKTL